MQAKSNTGTVTTQPGLLQTPVISLSDERALRHSRALLEALGCTVSVRAINAVIKAARGRGMRTELVMNWLKGTPVHLSGRETVRKRTGNDFTRDGKHPGNTTERSTGAHAPAPAPAELGSNSYSAIDQDIATASSDRDDLASSPKREAHASLAAVRQPKLKLRTEPSERDLKAFAILSALWALIKPTGVTGKLPVAQWRTRNLAAARGAVDAEITAEELVAAWEEHRAKIGTALYMVSKVVDAYTRQHAQRVLAARPARQFGLLPEEVQ